MNLKRKIYKERSIQMGIKFKLRLNKNGYIKIKDGDDLLPIIKHSECKIVSNKKMKVRKSPLAIDIDPNCKIITRKYKHSKRSIFSLEVPIKRKCNN
jgi:hypothetical protein